MTDYYHNFSQLQIRDSLPTIAQELGICSEQVLCLTGSSISDRFGDIMEENSPYYSKGTFQIRDSHFNKLPGIRQKSNLDNHNSSEIHCLELMQHRTKPHLKYVWWCIKDGQNNFNIFAFIERRYLIEMYLDLKRAQKKCVVIEKPVLPEGILSKIYLNTVGFYKRRREFRRFSIGSKRGLLLYGAPGLGKTMTLRYLEQLCTLHNIEYSSYNTRDVQQAHQNGSLDAMFHNEGISVFDDIDIGYLQRGGSGHSEIAGAILTAMDGVHVARNSIRVFCTNEDISALDKAFVRSGRIDAAVKLELPSRQLRAKYIGAWLPELLEHVDQTALLNLSEDLSFADLMEIKSQLVSQYVDSGNASVTEAFREFRSKTEADLAIKKKVGFGVVGVQTDDDDYGIFPDGET